MKKKSPKTISAKEFDERFDRGEDMGDYLSSSLTVFRANVDFPDWVVRALDKEADRQGVTRQSLIKMWIVEKLDGLRDKGKKPKRRA